MLKAMWNDENGAIVSIEMIIIITVAVISLIVGWTEVAVAINTELDDISGAVGHLDQSYSFTNMGAPKGATVGGKSSVPGSTFVDNADECDDCDGSSTLICAGVSSPGTECD
jgi:hypothetical protein